MISLYRYQIPFEKPFVTAKGTYRNREGFLISIESGKITSISEAAPLPGFSSESPEEVQQLLQAHKNELDNFFTSEFSKADLNNFLDTLPGIPSIQFALSSLGSDVLIQSGRQTVFDLFGRNAAPQLMINAVIGSMEEEKLLQEIDALYLQGYKTIKIKATTVQDNNAEQLSPILGKAVKKFPDIIFRIDANQSWPAAGLTRRIQSFAGLHVEYIEEPVSIQSIEEYPEIIRSSPVPVALDESLSDLDKLGTALKLMPETVVIIKPMLLGNIFTIHETISSQRGLLNDVVVTTALESAVGRHMVASIASITGDPERAHGLDTGRLFEKDLHPGLQVIKGVLTLDQPFRSLTVSDLDHNLITKIL